jgi:S1-C subfamily serine protease
VPPLADLLPGQGSRAALRQSRSPGAQYLIGGDTIVSINGTKIVNTDALSTYLVQNTAAGQVISIGVMRSGTLVNITVTLGTRPAA